MKIMWRDFEKNSFESEKVVSEIYKEALKVQILNEVTLRQVVRKRFSFKDTKIENTPKFASFEQDYDAT